LSDYRPLSKIGQYDPDLDTLHEEMEPWMVESIRAWLAPWLSFSTGRSRRPQRDFIKEMERALRLREPFDWQRASGELAHVNVLSRVGVPGSFGMDCVGFVVSKADTTDQ
jgi:hypothetical protein